MTPTTSSLSAELVAANRRLNQLREHFQANRKNNQLEQKRSLAEDVLPWEEGRETAVSFIPQLPDHLGWESEAVTRVIRIARQRHQQQTNNSAKLLMSDSCPLPSSFQGSKQQGQPFSSQRQLQTDAIKHYPSLGVAAFKTEQVSLYRVWLMCQYLDVNGRGWIPVQDVREQLTGKESQLRLFCWRRLRQILGQGHVRFWQWDKVQGRLWLFGIARVAAYLDMERLTGKPVALPVKTITAGVGEFKAHLYAAWHSGRKTNYPISREVQQSITSIPERTQRHYCKIAAIRRQTNIAIGNKTNPEEAEKQAWQRGQATFEFVDHQGQQGRKGTTYIAWHLPNSYTGPHQQSPKGRMRKINQKLTDLVNVRAQGNDSEMVEKLYFVNGKEAGKSLNRGEVFKAYWPLVSGAWQNGLWAVFSLI